MALLTLFRTAQRAGGIAGGTTLVSDAFTRTVASGVAIGTSDSGHVWNQNSTTNVSVNGTQLVFALAATQNRTANVGPAVLDSDPYFEFQASALPSSGTMTIALLARSVSASEQLRGKVVVSSVGVITCQGFTIHPSFDAAAETSIAAATTLTRLGTFATSTKYRARMQVNGTAVKLKVWARHQPEPSAWDWSSTQTKCTAAGTNGIRIIPPSASACTYTVDDFLVRAVSPTTPLEVATVPLPSGITLQSVLTDTLGQYPNGSTVITNLTYAEDNLSIPASRDLTFRSLTPGSTRINAYAAATSPTWTADTDDVWYSTVAHHVYSVLVDGRPLYDFGYTGSSGTLADLKGADWPSGAGATGNAPPEGFYWDDATDRLYIRIRNAADNAYVDPNSVNSTIVWNRTGINDGSTGHCFTFASTSGSLNLDGIRISGFPRSAVNLKASCNLTMTDCWIHACSHGWICTNPATTPIVRVTNTTITGRGNGTHNYVSPYVTRHTLGNEAFDGLYDSNLAMRVCLSHATDQQVSRCYIHDLFDGIEFKGISEDAHSTLSEFSYNFIQNIVDNPIEVEPDERYVLLRAHHNMLLDGVTFHATSPFQAGEYEFDHNICYQSPDYGAGADTTTAFLKTVSHSGTSTVPPMTGMSTHHNTVLLDADDSQVFVNGDSETFGYTASDLTDNLIRAAFAVSWQMGGRTANPSETGYQVAAENIIWGTGQTVAKWTRGATSYVNSATHADARPVGGILAAADPGFADAGADPETIFYLASDSDAIGVASGGGDLGAIPYGETWDMPVTGCTFATTYDAPMPSDVDAAWGGRS